GTEWFGNVSGFGFAEWCDLLLAHRRQDDGEPDGDWSDLALHRVSISTDANSNPNSESNSESNSDASANSDTYTYAAAFAATVDSRCSSLCEPGTGKGRQLDHGLRSHGGRRCTSAKCGWRRTEDHATFCKSD